MRKFLIIALILGFVLSGCTTLDPDHDTTNTLDSHLSEPSEDWLSLTDPTDTLEGITSGPVTSDLTSPTPHQHSLLSRGRKRQINPKK